MAILPMDFSGEMKPLTPGTYAARIIGAVGKVSKAGNNYIDWQIETFGSPEVNGRQVFYGTPLSGGWVSKLAELHRAATGEDIDKTAKGYDPGMLVGKEITVTVVTESYTTNTGEAKIKTAVKSVARPPKQ
jgi:hypothetical protein